MVVSRSAEQTSESQTVEKDRSGSQSNPDQTLQYRAGQGYLPSRAVRACASCPEETSASLFSPSNCGPATAHHDTREALYSGRDEGPPADWKPSPICLASVTTCSTLARLFEGGRGQASVPADGTWQRKRKADSLVVPGGKAALERRPLGAAERADVRPLDAHAAGGLREFGRDELEADGWKKSRVTR